VKGRSEGGGQLEDRKRDDVYHQRGPASEAIGDEAEEKRTDWPHGQRQENRFGDGGDLRVKSAGDGADAEDQNEKIEGVQRPAEEAGDERIALDGSEAAEVSEKFYASLLDLE
jgi:hypothetical protein